MGNYAWTIGERAVIDGRHHMRLGVVEKVGKVHVTISGEKYRLDGYKVGCNAWNIVTAEPACGAALVRYRAYEAIEQKRQLLAKIREAIPSISGDLEKLSREKLLLALAAVQDLYEVTP